MTSLNIDEQRYSPPYEIIEKDEVFIRISIPGMLAKDINVWTTGTLLFVATYSVSEDNIKTGFRRTSGESLTPNFKIEFNIDADAVIGGPFIYQGVLNIPVRTKKEILANIREYTVRELSKSEAEVVECGAENWIFKDAYK